MAKKAKKSVEVDPFEIPVFLRRNVGNIAIIGYERDEKNKLIKIGDDGSKYDAMTDKKLEGKNVNSRKTTKRS